MELYRLLKKGYNAAHRDCTIFNSWADRNISTFRAIELFRISNKIRPEVEISEEEFTQWLNSLGYFRGI